MRIVAACDGSALGNPGPAGWAWYIDEESWRRGGWPKSTNNRGELYAVLDLLRCTRDSGADLLILADSKYTINSLTDWRFNWRARGWRKSNRKPIENLDLMQQLDTELDSWATAGREVKFDWVKGHAGHDLNELVDGLARGAARAYQAGHKPQPGPGYKGTGEPGANTEPTPNPGTLF
ncbi:MAG: ribonuclease H [Varibaculum sp.]|nr:ribonuclease H [Varibaculum sp.]